MIRLFVFTLGVITICAGCREAYSVVSIAPDASIGPTWTMIRLAKPIGWSNPEQEIAFRIKTKYKVGEDLSIVLPSGEHVVPEVELIAASGQVYRADVHSFLGDEMIYSFAKKPADFRSVETVQIRSRVPIVVLDMAWIGYDPSKVKR